MLIESQCGDEGQILLESNKKVPKGLDSFSFIYTNFTHFFPFIFPIQTINERHGTGLALLAGTSHERDTEQHRNLKVNFRKG